MESKTTAIRAIKQEIRLREWSAQVKAQQESGMTVRQWCVINSFTIQQAFNGNYIASASEITLNKGVIADLNMVCPGSTILFGTVPCMIFLLSSMLSM